MNWEAKNLVYNLCLDSALRCISYIYILATEFFKIHVYFLRCRQKSRYTLRENQRLKDVEISNPSNITSPSLLSMEKLIRLSLWISSQILILMGSLSSKTNRTLKEINSNNDSTINDQIKYFRSVMKMFTYVCMHACMCICIWSYYYKSLLTVFCTPSLAYYT